MNFIIFKINFSKYYNGIETKNLNIYDKFYQEKKSNNPEIYNFQDYNGFCYGYAPLKQGVVNLSKIKFSNDNSTLSDNTLVVWVYEKNNKNYIVGWYKNATVYKFLQRELSFPSVGRDLYYNTKAKSKDCYLLKEEDRTFTLDIPFEKDTNFYMSTENDILYPKILSYISSYNKSFANINIKDIIDIKLENCPNNPILLYKRATIYLYNENNFIEALRYINSALDFKENLSQKELTDLYYIKALCLQFLNAFDYSIIYFEKVISFIKYDLDILRNMIYLYIYINDYKKALSTCDKILNKENRTEISSIYLDEILGIKVDILLRQNKISEAKSIIKDILNKCCSESLSLHFKAILSALE